jgi:hypothetical protein
MPKNLHYLPNPNEDAKKRIIEIQFYIFIQSIIRFFNTTTTQFFLETLCEILEVKKNIISISASEIIQYKLRPTKLEIAIASRYLEIPFRKVSKYNKTCTKTIYKNLNEYLTHQIPLTPKFKDDRHETIEEFLKKFNTMLEKGMDVAQYDLSKFN